MGKRDIQHIHLVKTRRTTYAFSQCKLNFVLFSPMPLSLYEKIFMPYSFKIALSVWVGNGTHHIEQCRPNGNSPQVSMSTNCRTKHTCRHRESMRKQAQGTRALSPRKHRTTTGTPFVVYLHDKKHCEAGEAGARHWCVLTKDLQLKHPGDDT